MEIDRKRSGVMNFIIEKFTSNSGQYITTILVGNNIALVIYSMFMVELIHSLAGKMGATMASDSIIIETLISTVIIILFGEYGPKIIFKHRANTYFRVFAIPIYILYIILYPIAKITTWISFFLLRLFGLPVKKDHSIKSFGKIDLENLLEKNNENEQEQEIKMFQNALDFSDLRVRDCMVPRVDVEAISIDSSIEELTQLFVDTQYSRILVWEGSIDNIVGYVNTKSLFNHPDSLRQILMTVNYVPETMSAEKLLAKFIKNKASIAVVIDEFGGTAGIISMEDVLEEIFGEIEDEHDHQELIERQVSDKEWILSCRLEVDYLNEKYGIDLEESEEYDTLAGYIIDHQKEIPSVGTIIIIDKKEIKIVKSSSSKVELARVKLL